MCNENGKWSIDDYVNGDCSICREERQYALYLSNVLRYYGKHHQKLKENYKAQNIFKSIFGEWEPDENHTVDYVFYESTFMRDIFERNRRYYLTKDKDCANLKKVYAKKSFKPACYTVDKKDSFNHKLVKFCCGNEVPYDDSISITEINYGHNAPDEYYKNIKNKMQAMMNAKPDLAIIYKENGDRYLLFIECKFDSYEGRYYNNGNDNDDEKVIYQREAQGLIAEFLCKDKNSYFSDLKVSKIMKHNMKKYKTQYISEIVQFFRDAKCSGGVEIDNEEKIVKINITDLIKLESKIFE